MGGVGEDHILHNQGRGAVCMCVGIKMFISWGIDVAKLCEYTIFILN